MYAAFIYVYLLRLTPALRSGLCETLFKIFTVKTA